MAIAFLIVLLILFTMNWDPYSVKSTLKKNGYPTSLFSNPLRDIQNLFNLAEQATDKGLRRKCYGMAISKTIITIGIPLAIIAISILKI